MRPPVFEWREYIATSPARGDSDTTESLLVVKVAEHGRPAVVIFHRVVVAAVDMPAGGEKRGIVRDDSRVVDIDDYAVAIGSVASTAVNDRRPREGPQSPMKIGSRINESPMLVHSARFSNIDNRLLRPLTPGRSTPDSYDVSQQVVSQIDRHCCQIG